MVSIVIIHHENISIDISYVTLLRMLSTVLNKTYFDNGRTNLHIKNIPQGCRSDNPTGFHQCDDKSTKKTYTIEHSYVHHCKYWSGKWTVCN